MLCSSPFSQSAVFMHLGTKELFTEMVSVIISWARNCFAGVMCNVSCIETLSGHFLNEWVSACTLYVVGLIDNWGRRLARSV
jgi:hypothetical protein